MESLEGLAQGFAVALEPLNLLYVMIGVLLGTLIGLLPGLGPTAAIAILLPITFNMEPASAIIMLAGIYYGCMYGGRIPAILLNVPGDPSSVITAIEGHPMARRGRAGPALGLTAISSFVGGTLAIIGLTLFAPWIAGWASRIGPPEIALLSTAGLLLASIVSSGPKIKAIMMACFGLVLAAVGTDMISGDPRLTMGSLELSSGIDMVALAVGLFGVGEILYLAERRARDSAGGRKGKVSGFLPSKLEWVQSRMAIARSAFVGFLIGIMPGGGGALSSIVAYGAQKKLSKNPERFGQGAHDGLAATETADNASSTSAFIPLLTLGLPPNSVLALLFGVMVMHNVTPGPSLIEQHPGVFWGVIASMYIGNAMLLILNLPLVKVFTKILDVPSGILYPIIVGVAFAGVYSANNSLFDVWTAMLFGVVGYLLKRASFDLTPVILAFVLGPMIESNFRRTLSMSGGSLDIFLERPGTLLIIAVLVGVGVVLGIANSRRNRRSILET